MPRKLTPAAEITGKDVVPQSPPDVLQDAAKLGELTLAQQPQIDLPYTKENRIDVCLASMRTIVGNYLLLGAALCDIKAHEDAGTFLSVVAQVGLGARSAQRYMQLWRTYKDEKRRLFAENKSASFLMELAQLDDNALDDGIESGLFDDLDRLPRKQMKEELRKLRDERQSQADLIEAKNKKIDELDVQIGRWRKTKPRERAEVLLGDVAKITGEIVLASKRLNDAADAVLAAYGEQDVDDDIRDTLRDYISRAKVDLLIIN